MSTRTEGSDWARPPGCACATWEQHERCYEYCDPVKPKSERRLWPVGLAAVLVIVIALGHLFWINQARSADLNLYFRDDPYECFGAGRYDAMSRGFDKTDCPKPGQEYDDIDGHYRYPLGHAAWRLPSYCDALKLMDRSCTSVKAVAKVYGRAGAERRARACGASDSDIAQADACFDEKK